MMATIVLLGAVGSSCCGRPCTIRPIRLPGQPVVVDAGMIAWFAVAAAPVRGGHGGPAWVGLRRMERSSSS